MIGPGSQNDSHRGRLADSYICLAATVLVGVMLLAASLMVNSVQRDAIASGFSEARHLSRLLTLQWSQTEERITALNRLGRIVNEAYSTNSPDFDRLLAQLRRQVDITDGEVVQVGGTDAAGNMIWSTNPLPDHKVSVASHEHYQAIAGRGLERFVGVSLQGNVSHRPTLRFASAVRDQSHRLLGMIVVSVNFDLARLYRQQLESGPGMIAIFRSDGLLLSRSRTSPVARDFVAHSPMFQRAVDQGMAEEVHGGRIDNVPRFYVERRSDGWGLVLAVALDVEQALAGAHRAQLQIWQSAAVASVALLGLAGALIAVVRRQRKLVRERRRSMELARRERLLRQIAEKATDLISLQDANLRHIYVSPACKALLGYEPDDLVGRKIGFTFVPDPQVEEALATLIREGGSQRFICQPRHADGSIRWMEVVIVAMDAEEDGVDEGCRFISIARDVTVRQQNEDELVEKRRQIDNMLRLGPGFFYNLRLGLNGEREVSLPFVPEEQLFGYTLDQVLVPGFFFSRVHPDHVLLLKQALKRCVNTGQAAVEYRVQTKSGETRWLYSQMRLTSLKGAWAEIICYVTDNTVEHQARLRLQRAERLATLGQVSAGIAHEMNQPLATIAMAAENGLRSIQSGADCQRHVAGKLERILSQTHRLSQVIHHIRRFGRAERGRAAAFDIEDVVVEAQMLARSRLDSAGVVVASELAPDLPKLFAERILLEQVLMNLMLNACDAYGPHAATDAAITERPLLIRVKLEGRSIVIRVADRAGGIVPEVMESVFDPFVTTKSVGHGTGLGLSISAANVQELGGTIIALNEDGGAVFEIRLPRTVFAEVVD